MEEFNEKAEFLSRLGLHCGNVKATCGATGVARSTYYHWRRTDPEFAEQCDIIISSHKAKRQEDRKSLNGYGGEPSAEGADSGQMVIEPERYDGQKALLYAREHEIYLKASMEAAGIWHDSYAPQIRAAAKLYASNEILFSQLDRYAPLQTEISREGNIRLVANPIHEMIRRQTDTYTAILRSLGLNLDAKTKAREPDGMEEFLKQMSND